MSWELWGRWFGLRCSGREPRGGTPIFVVTDQRLEERLQIIHSLLSSQCDTILQNISNSTEFKTVRIILDNYICETARFHHLISVDGIRLGTSMSARQL